MIIVHKFTQDEAEFLKEHVYGLRNPELTEMFNTHFGLNLGLNQIKAYKKNHRLNSGLDGRFPLEHTPFNKGRKGVDGWEPTQFKKGNRPANWVPIGSERVNGDGYVDIKVTDGKLHKNWKGKHIIIWEAANGPLPKGHAVIFGDRNKRNFELDNLILVSRKQLVRLNKLNLIQNDAELTRTGVIIADIYNKIGERKKRKT